MIDEALIVLLSCLLPEHPVKAPSKEIHNIDTSISNIPLKAIYNKDKIVEFINICANLLNTGSTQYMPLLKKQLLLATQLIALIDKEYDFKNENN